MNVRELTEQLEAEHLKPWATRSAGCAEGNTGSRRRFAYYLSTGPGPHHSLAGLQKIET
jgi:hypothetical protein